MIAPLFSTIELRLGCLTPFKAVYLERLNVFLDKNVHAARLASFEKLVRLKAVNTSVLFSFPLSTLRFLHEFINQSWISQSGLAAGTI